MGKDISMAESVQIKGAADGQKMETGLTLCHAAVAFQHSVHTVFDLMQIWHIGGGVPHLVFA